MWFLLPEVALIDVLESKHKRPAAEWGEVWLSTWGFVGSHSPNGDPRVGQSERSICRQQEMHSFNTLLYFYLPPSLSFPLPLVMEVLPQKYGCWWRESDLFHRNTYNWGSQAVTTFAFYLFYGRGHWCHHQKASPYHCPWGTRSLC